VKPEVQNQHGKQPVLDLVKADHLMQLSVQFMEQWSTRSAGLDLSDPSTVNPALATQIRSILQAGRDPLIEMQDQSGHVVVAYDIVTTGTGTYDVYVYDSNDQFQSGEDSNAASHAARVQNAVIHLAANGTWSLASTVESDGSTPWHGGPGGLVVTDPTVVPKNPTLPSAGGAAPPGALFSSNGASSGSTAAAARVTQVSSGGRTLYDNSGALNTNAATRLQAAPMGPFVSTGSAAEPGQLFALGKQVGNSVHVTTEGTQAGNAAMTLVRGAYAGSVKASTTAGAVQSQSFAAGSGKVSFSGPSDTPVTLSVSRSTSSTEHTVSVTLGQAGTSDSLQLGGGHGAVTLAHTGPATTLKLTLSGSSAGGLPTTFRSPSFTLGSGESLSISNAKWGKGGSVTVQVGSRRLTLANHASKAARATISKLHVSRHHKNSIHVRLKGRLPKLSTTSTATILWLVQHGHTLIRSHRTTLHVSSRRVSKTWAIKQSSLHKWANKKLTFRAIVVTASVHGLQEAGGVRSRSTTYTIP
jgi:hypothetical protein